MDFCSYRDPLLGVWEILAVSAAFTVGSSLPLPSSGYHEGGSLDPLAAELKGLRTMGTVVS